MVAGHNIGHGYVAHHRKSHAAGTGVARKHNIQRTPFRDATNFAPFPCLGGWGSTGLASGQPHKVANLEDWDGTPIGAEIKLHGRHFAQSLGD
jgi:hypothetical protein